MDFRRHVTAGRLSELVGKNGLETDELVRTLGWRRVAEQEYEQLGAKTRSLLEAYARGVNSYIDGKSGSELSLEYAVLSLTGPDYRPEPWTPVDSVAWVKAMAWDLRSNMTDEIDRTMASRQMSTKDVEALYPDPPGPTADRHRPAAHVRGKTFGEPPTPSHRRLASLQKTRDAAEALPALLGTGEGIGSNSWVVDGKHSAPGEPILANDPHLAPSMPGSGTRSDCTAARSPRPARTTCRASRSPACPASSSGTTGASPGASARCMPTSPTCTSSESATRTSTRASSCRSRPAARRSRSPAGSHARSRSARPGTARSCRTSATTSPTSAAPTPSRCSGRL